MLEPAAPDLDRYFRRVGFDGAAPATPGTLARLQLAHATTIPFENLDVRLKRPIRLDLASLEAQMVARRRGGYCFQQNSLFVAVLRALGFTVETLEARVRPPGAASVLARTHMVLLVRHPEGDHVVDVGFGADGPLAPVPVDGTPVESGGDTNRIVEEPGGLRVLQRRVGEGWADLWAALPSPVLPIDYVVANHFTSTWPESTFVRSLTAQRPTLEARHHFRGRTYTCRRGEQSEARDLDDAEVFALLRDTMGLEVTADEVRAALADSPV